MKEDWKETESVIFFMIIGFGIPLKGEEVPLIVIDGILTFWEETRKHQIPHIMSTLRGNSRESTILGSTVFQ